MQKIILGSKISPLDGVGYSWMFSFLPFMELDMTYVLNFVDYCSSNTVFFWSSRTTNETFCTTGKNLDQNHPVAFVNLQYGSLRFELQRWLMELYICLTLRAHRLINLLNLRPKSALRFGRNFLWVAFESDLDQPSSTGMTSLLECRWTDAVCAGDGKTFPVYSTARRWRTFWCIWICFWGPCVIQLCLSWLTTVLAVWAGWRTFSLFLSLSLSSKLVAHTSLFTCNLHLAAPVLNMYSHNNMYVRLSSSMVAFWSCLIDVQL